MSTQSKDKYKKTRGITSRASLLFGSILWHNLYSEYKRVSFG